jgi:N12 class adenine-specific DNA methylase
MNIDPIQAQTRAIELQTIALAATAVVGPVVSVCIAYWMQRGSEKRQREFQKQFTRQQETDRRNYEDRSENNRRAYEEKREHLRQKYESSIVDYQDAWRVADRDRFVELKNEIKRIADALENNEQ